MFAALSLIAAGCTGDDPATKVPSPLPTSVVGDAAVPPPASEKRPMGGSARVGVWAHPNPLSPTLGGAAVRALVLPQLFVARPDGRWESALAAPGTDRTSDDRRSATLKLVPGATWSDGSPLGADDLRRTADKRFVAGVDGPDADGTVTLRFTQALPGWRRLWSGVDSIGAPRPGVWGGPFVVSSVTPGLEAVLVPNERWWGRAEGRGPFLSELRLVLVPDPTVAAELLKRGELDVLMPLAGTVGIEGLRRLAGVEVDEANRSGWWEGLVVNPDKVAADRRRALFETVDRARFVDVLLEGQASRLDGLAGPEDATWAPVVVGEAKGLGKVQLTGMIEEPMTSLLQRAMQKRARAGGGELELRNAETDRVEGWVASGAYEAAISVLYDGPSMCWSCRFGPLDGALASAADAGDSNAIAALEAKARDEAVLLPLWRSRAVIAWRTPLNGVAVNGYGLSAAWNAWRWWREP